MSTLRDEIEAIVNAIGEISKTEAMTAIDALLAAEGRHEENDFSAGLIGQAIPDVAERVDVPDHQKGQK